MRLPALLLALLALTAGTALAGHRAGTAPLDASGDAWCEPTLPAGACWMKRTAKIAVECRDGETYCRIVARGTPFMAELSPLKSIWTDIRGPTLTHTYTCISPALSASCPIELSNPLTVLEPGECEKHELISGYDRLAWRTPVVSHAFSVCLGEDGVTHTLEALTT